MVITFVGIEIRVDGNIAVAISISTSLMSELLTCGGWLVVCVPYPMACSQHVHVACCTDVVGTQACFLFIFTLLRACSRCGYAIMCTPTGCYATSVVVVCFLSSTPCLWIC